MLTTMLTKVCDNDFSLDFNCDLMDVMLNQLTHLTSLKGDLSNNSPYPVMHYFHFVINVLCISYFSLSITIIIFY